MQAAAGIFVQLLGVLLKIGNQGSAVGAALFRLAQAIELQLHPLQADFLPQAVRQQNDFGIDLSAAKTQGFSADLVELAVTPALRALVAEHRPGIVQTLAAFVQQIVFNRSAAHARRTFGAQGEFVAVEFVLKGVHLFFHNIGGFAYAAYKQGRGFDYGQARVAVGKTGHDGAHLLLQPFPMGRSGRQDVIHAFNCEDFLDFWGCAHGKNTSKTGAAQAALAA